ncbi:MAG: SRPBCC family protein [Betaproteobacteria bacterium]|nr:MAG: SRPBCC family protein [Betaproteobacteria bacterium]
MKVKIDKSFPMPCSAPAAWVFLQDLEAVAGCMPGAKITERLDEGRYKGTVTVKVGPAKLSFNGEVEMKDIDTANRTLHLLGKGTDKSGSSSATMDLNAHIEDAEDGLCNLVGSSEVSMSGKAATFGGRMMNSVSDQILKQFAANFATQASALQEQHAELSKNNNTEKATEAAPNAPAAATPAPPPANELNGLALMWSIFKDWLRGLFSGTTK